MSYVIVVCRGICLGNVHNDLFQWSRTVPIRPSMTRLLPLISMQFSKAQHVVVAFFNDMSTFSQETFMTFIYD